MIYTTLKDIRDAKPCETFDTLLEHLGKTRAEAKTDDEPLPVLTVLESNGVDDALWVLDNAVGNQRICRLFAADCAERVLHIFESAMPGDTRPREAISVVRNPNSDAAARAAARDAAGAAARDAARAAAWAAAGAAAWDAAGDAARDAAWAAVRAAAWDAAWAAQKRRLVQYLTHGEPASDMPWPDAGDTGKEEVA
mgnify:FL=1